MPTFAVFATREYEALFGECASICDSMSEARLSRTAFDRPATNGNENKVSVIQRTGTNIHTPDMQRQQFLKPNSNDIRRPLAA